MFGIVELEFLDNEPLVILLLVPLLLSPDEYNTFLFIEYIKFVNTSDDE